MRVIKAAFIIAAILFAAVSAMADVSMGGQARFYAMGGAGLASIDNPSETATMNPAAMGLLSKRVRFTLPNFGIRADGASVDDISKWANDIWDLSGTQGVEIAREFGTHDTTLDAGASTGISGLSISAMLDGEARLKIIPNDEFKEFARTGNLPSDPSKMEAVVWAEAAASVPSISAGFKVPKFATGKGDLWIGARVRAVKGRYIRRTINWSGSNDPNNALTTSSEPVKEESGIGGDFGLIYRAPGKRQMSYGLAVTNLLKPSLGDIDQETIWNVGVSMQPTSKMVVVADIVNLTDAYDEGTDLRMGVEFRPVRWLGLRAGYTGHVLTTGVGVFGYDFAFASETPLSISRTIRF
ncbi:MAG: hypothetical protein ABFD46_06080 [Armatimonadota bacterium]